MTEIKKANLDIDVFPNIVSKAQADRALPYEITRTIRNESKPFCKARRTWKDNVLDTVACLVIIGAIVTLWILASVVI